MPTWAAYNSLLSERHSVTKICTLSIISGSPTQDWSNLSSALEVTEDMLNSVNKGEKTIVSLHLQLCHMHSATRTE